MQVRNDHARLPRDIVYRLHSDLGGEFMDSKLINYCDFHGIFKTTTAGYDPNANPAEPVVGL